MRRYFAAGVLGGFLSLIPASAVSSDSSSIQFEDRQVIRINLSESESQRQESKVDVNQSVDVNVTNNISVSPVPMRVVQTPKQSVSRPFSPAGSQRVMADTVTPERETKGGVTYRVSPHPGATPTPEPRFEPTATPTSSPGFSPTPSPTPNGEEALMPDGEPGDNGVAVSPSPEQESTATAQLQEEPEQRSFFGRIYDGIRNRLRSIGRFLRSIGLG